MIRRTLLAPKGTPSSRHPFSDPLRAFSFGLLSQSPLQMISASLQLWMRKEDSLDSMSPLGAGWVQLMEARRRIRGQPMFSVSVRAARQRRGGENRLV